MNRQDIRILVINRRIYPYETDYHDLEDHIKALRAYGYDVTEQKRARNLGADYNIVVAHPTQLDIGSLLEFHKSHTDVPLVLFSGYRTGKGPSKISTFKRDSDGAYYSWASSMQDFLKLIKYLTSKIG